MIRRGAHARPVTLLFVLSLLASGCGSSDDSQPPEALGLSDESGAVVVDWFVGLGTGAREEQIDIQKDVVEQFNQSQDDIELRVEFVANKVAYEILEERREAGTLPDIIGPIGIKGSNVFAGSFLDLEPLIEETGLDLSVYDPEQVEVWREDDGSLGALPFGVFPAMIFYNTEIFAEAGLPGPPATFDQPYQDGEWDVEALFDLAVTLTHDVAGNTPRDPGFDSDAIVQWGFHPQWIQDARAVGTLFGAGELVAADGSAQIPDEWLTAWEWYHRLIWEDHGAPNRAEFDSELLDRGNTFNSGNVAMVLSHLWYTSGLADEDGNPQDFFDLAVVPTHQGTATSNLHADTFRIFSASEHPDEAFEVLEYLTSPESAELLRIYGSFPARRDMQGAFLDALDDQFPQTVNWNVVEESLARPDVPSHEAYVPGFLAVDEALTDFVEQLVTDPDLDVAERSETLRQQLDDIFAGADQTEE